MGGVESKWQVILNFPGLSKSLTEAVSQRGYKDPLYFLPYSDLR